MSGTPRLPVGSRLGSHVGSQGGLSRRRLLGLLGTVPAAAALAAGAPGARAAGTGQLNIYSWPDYFSKESLAAYAKQSGVTPNISTYDSNETMFAKLNSPAGAGFDIIIPSSGWIQQLAAKKLVQPLDHSRLNLASLDQNLLNRDYDPGNKYSIPKDWGLLGIVYDPAVCGEIKTWQDVFDAGAKPEVSGKIRLSDTGWETIGPQLWIEGKDWNTVDDAAIREAGEKVKEFAKHVKTFASFDASAVATGSIVLAECNQAAARRAIMQNPKLKWVVPAPHSELWVDSYAISANAPNLDQAYDFLAYQLRPEVQLSETEYLGFPAALAGLREKISATTPHGDLIFGGKDVDFAALTSFVVNPATISTYLQMQTEIQAAAG